MKISLRNLKDSKVFEYGQSEPCGKVAGVRFSECEKRVTAVYVETLSLVPLNKTISITDIERVAMGKVLLKPDVKLMSLKKIELSDVPDKNISKVVSESGVYGKIKNMQFDFETGEIFNFEVDKGFFRKSDRISVDKMQIKDNIIYVE